MTWGDELWDKFGEIEKYFDQKSEYVDSLVTFMKEQCKLHESHTKKVQKSIKVFQDNCKKKKNNLIAESSFFSFSDELQGCYNMYLTTYNHFQAELLRITTEFQKRNQELLKTKSKAATDLNKCCKLFNSQNTLVKNELRTLQQKKVEIFHLKEQKNSLSMDDTKKIKQVTNDLTSKTNNFIKQKANYDKESSKLMSLSRNYYQSVLPESLNKVESIEIERNGLVHETLSSFLETLCELYPKSLEHLQKLTSYCKGSISFDKDHKAFMDSNKSDERRPSEVEVTTIELEYDGGTRYTSSKSIDTPNIPYTPNLQDRASTDVPTYDMSMYSESQKAEKASEHIKEFENAMRQLQSEKSYIENSGKSSSEVKRLVKNVDDKIEHCKRSITELEKYTGHKSADFSTASTSAYYPPAASMQQGTNDTMEYRVGVVKFGFQSQEPGELSASVGERLVIVMPDDGSGWTLVARSDSINIQGFFPTSYLGENE